MSDLRYFYVPDALAHCESNKQAPATALALGKESTHILKVLRMREGDPINIVDGRGHFIHALLGEKGSFLIQKVEDMAPLWPRPIHLCVAPTKNMDRMEWLVEKAVEIGVDSISFVKCRYSERNNVNVERLNRIAASAMTQSHKFYLPQIHDIVPFSDFIQSFCQRYPSSTRFIAHCYEDIPRTFLLDAAKQRQKELQDSSPEILSSPGAEQNEGISICDCPLLTCIGPEGDFSKPEVELALNSGFQSVSLGSSRLRTETAGLVAVHLMHLFSTYYCAH